MDIDRALREEVALANRIIERFGLAHAFGHVSARVPGTGTFLLPTRRSPGFADADRLLVIDFDGNVIAGDGEPNSEHWIHGRIYAARADAMSVVHAHPPACVCLTQIGQPHRVVHNQGGPFGGSVAEYERTTSSSWPSGAAAFTCSIAMNPLAPGFASTITGRPHAFASLSATVRVNTAGAAPAEYGAVIRTGFAGNDCACVAAESSAAASTSAKCVSAIETNRSETAT